MNTEELRDGTYDPYPRRLDSLNICKCDYKNSTERQEFLRKNDMLDNKVKFDSKWNKNNLFELPKVNILHSSYHFYFSLFVLIYFILSLGELEWVERTEIKGPK